MEENKASPGSATAQVIERIVMMVVSGELSPGEQVRQIETAEKCGFSRVPLREALNSLALQGILVHKPNVGYFVAKRGPAELAQIRRMRILLETEVLAHLPWPADGQVQALRDTNQRMRDVMRSQSWFEFPVLNRKFHAQILDLSPQRLIVEQILNLYRMGNQMFSTEYQNIEVCQRSIEEHDAIIDALAAQDHQALVDAFESHRQSKNVRLSQTLSGGHSTLDPFPGAVQNPDFV